MNQMQMKFLLSFTITCLIGCTPDKVAKSHNSNTPGSNIIAAPCNYEKNKQYCQALFNKYNHTKSATDNNQLQKYFADSLLACWYGTAWDYNGTTTTPAIGKIARGYFITTTLQQTGLPVNRIKLAQCPSSELIRAVCNGIKIYSNKPITEVVNSIKKEGQGIYIAGLDFHTGFIYYDGEEVYFIHASFYGNKCVTKEKAIDCAVLKNSKLKITGKVNFIK
jgi:hypothetical protein